MNLQNLVYEHFSGTDVYSQHIGDCSGLLAAAAPHFKISKGGPARHKDTFLKCQHIRRLMSMHGFRRP